MRGNYPLSFEFWEHELYILVALQKYKHQKLNINGFKWSQNSSRANPEESRKRRHRIIGQKSLKIPSKFNNYTIFEELMV